MYTATVLRNLSITKLEIKIKAIMGQGGNGAESFKTAILKLFSLHEFQKVFSFTEVQFVISSYK